MWLGALYSGAIGAVLFVVLVAIFKKMRAQDYQLPPLRIDHDDELMIAAIERARGDVPTFLELFHQRPRDSFIKFRLPEPAGAGGSLVEADPEFTWGQVEVWHEDGDERGAVRVKLLNRPERDDLAAAYPEGAELTLPQTELIDWQVMLPDRNIRGGYTMEVMFFRAAQQYGGLPPALAGEQTRYIDHGMEEDDAAKDSAGANAS